MLNRRDFGLSCAAWFAFGGAARRTRSERIKVGAQTNLYGTPVKTYDLLLGVLETLAKLEYVGFETNYRTLEPHSSQASQCRKAFESRGVPLVALHTSGKLWDRGTQAEEIEGLRTKAAWSGQMGAGHLIMSVAALPHVDGKLDRDAAHVRADGMNKLGESCRKEGLKLCLHTHRAEFEDTPSEMSILLAETDPALVWLNYDIGNNYPIGPDPAEFSTQHMRRIPIYHIKDVAPGAKGKPEPTDFGAGKIDIKAVVAPLLESDWAGWLIVEREGRPDPARGPEQMLKQCRQYVRQVAGV